MPRYTCHKVSFAPLKSKIQNKTKKETKQKSIKNKINKRGK